MAAKKRTGGRVTPKGTQPPKSSTDKGKDGAASAAAPRPVPTHTDPKHARSAFGSVGRTRNGPRGGNR